MLKVRKSINVKYDLNDESLLSEYYPTSAHSEIIKHVFKGVLGYSSRAHIAFGPYGAGKSYISTIITGFLSGKYSNEDQVLKFITKFKDVDVEASQYFEQINESSIKYIPVILNGYDGEFDKAIIKNLNKQIYSSTGISFDDKENQIKKIIDSWELNYKSTYLEFQNFLFYKQQTFKEFLENINDEINYKEFGKFYSEVTSGANLPLNLDIDLISTIEVVANKLKEHNLGLILIYDEFGRMLQNIKVEHLNKFMQQLQDIAELANNNTKNLSVLFIAHKPISHYFSYLDKDKRAEFSKIEKRFTITNINNDNSTFINITKQVLSEHRSVEPNNDYLEYNNINLRKFRVFTNNFNETEIDKIIVKGCYPIHPLSLYLLPIISKIYGQNERTLFSFLSDESSLGILGFLDKYKLYDVNVYTPDLLVDYFFTSIDNQEIIDSKDFLIFKRNYEELSAKFDIFDLNLAERIYKFIMIWNLTNSNNYALVNDELIIYALAEKKESIYKVLEKLTETKFIRFNKNRKHWQLIESSAINLDEEILKQKPKILSNKKILVETINKYNPYRYLYPISHNNRFEMTRFSFMRINLPELPKLDLSNVNYDFLIDININGNDENNDYDLRIIGRIDIDLDDLYKLLIKMTVIDNLSNDRQFLLENRNALSDLEYERSVVLKKLNIVFGKIVKGNKVETVFGETIVNSVNDLEQILDNLADNYFSSTIQIHNDQINMFEITKQQENPTIQIISKMLIYETNDLSEHLVGSKPDTLIYYSIKQANLQILKNDIINYIQKNKSVKFSELVSITKRPPYGLRPTISSLIIMYLIIDRWKNIMIFKNGNYVADIPAEVIYNTGLGKNDFEFTYSDFEFKNNELLLNLISVFNTSSEGVVNKSLSIKVLSSLNNWLISLPVITQLGENLSINEIAFIRIIQRSKVNPINSLNDITTKYTFSEIKEIKESIEKSFDSFISKLDEIIRIENKIDSWKKWSEEKEIVKIKTNKLVHISVENKDVIPEYAKHLDKLELERWPLAMFDMLKRSIESEIQDANGVNRTVKITVGDKIKEVNDIELSLKAKNMQRNLENLINANSKYLNSAEIEKVIIELVDRYIK